MVPKVRDIGTIVSVASVVGAAIKPAVAIKPQIKPQITKPIKKKKKIKKKLKKKKKQGPNSIGFILWSFCLKSGLRFYFDSVTH